MVLLALLLAFVMVFAVACTNGSGNHTDNNDTTPTTPHSGGNILHPLTAADKTAVFPAVGAVVKFFAAKSRLRDRYCVAYVIFRARCCVKRVFSVQRTHGKRC